MKAALIAPRGCVLAVLLAVSATAAAAEDIRDIRGPKSLLSSSSIWVIVLAGVLIAASAGAYVWHRHRHGTRRLTLSEKTLAALEEARSLMRPGSAREFGISTSEVIRSYIEKRFGVIATQRTTEEFLQGLLQSPDGALSSHRALLEDFLQHCDVIKFAGTGGALAELESLLASARGFVLATSDAPRA